MDGHQAPVTPHIGGNGTGTHVGLVAQNAVTHVIVVGHLHIVEQNYIFQFRRVTHHAVFSDEGRAPDVSAVAHFRTRPHNAGAADEGGGSHGV